MFVVHVAFNEKAFIIASELRCAQVRSSSSSSSPSALHQVFVSAPRTDPNTSNTCTCGNIMNGSWFLTNSKAKSTLHSWNKLHKVLNFCQINSSLVSKHAFYLRATFACTCMHLRILWSILKSFAWRKYQTGCEYHHIRSIYYWEQLITCSNNESMTKCRRIALSRACTDALAFLEHKPVVWSNTNRTGLRLNVIEMLILCWL